MLPSRNSVQQITEAPRIQWANGKNEIRSKPGEGRFVTGIPGWHSEAGKDAEFDAWCESIGLLMCQIRHPRQGAPAQIATHWWLGEQIQFYPLTSGPVAPNVAQSLARQNHTRTAEAGIGVRWGRGENERSKMAVRGYLCVGIEVYFGLVQISVKSRMTDELLSALIDHVRVCEVADQIIDRAKHPGKVQLYELALPLGPGKEEQWGRGETTTVTPLASQHAETIDLKALRPLWRPEYVIDWVARDWPEVQTWAREFSFAEQAEQPATYEDAL